MRKWYLEEGSAIRGAMLAIGFMLCLMSGLIYVDSSVPGSEAAAWAFGLGFGLLVGWPAGAVHFNLKSGHIRALLWEFADLAVRVALIFALEMLFRQFEARYAFKASFALLGMVGGFLLYPTLNPDADFSLVHRKRQMGLAFVVSMLGLLILAAGFSLKEMLATPWPQLIAALGFGVAMGPGLCYLHRLLGFGRDWLLILLLLVGMAAIIFVTGVQVGWGLSPLTAGIYGIGVLVTALNIDLDYLP